MYALQNTHGIGRTERLAGDIAAAVAHLAAAERLRPTHLPALYELRTLAGDMRDDALAGRVARAIKKYGWRQKQQQTSVRFATSESDSE